MRALLSRWHSAESDEHGSPASMSDGLVLRNFWLMAVSPCGGRGFLRTRLGLWLGLVCRLLGTAVRLEQRPLGRLRRLPRPGRLRLGRGLRLLGGLLVGEQ